MKRFLFTLIVIAGFQAGYGQRNADFGLLIGGSSYFGEINPVRPFYKPSIAYGGFFRFNINKRYAFRFSVANMPVQGDPADFPDRVYPNPDPGSNPNVSAFSTNLLDVAGQVEFNFLPYITGESKSVSSTYIAGGLGFASFGSYTMTIPFALGAKVNLGERLSAGGELGFRKTFTDELDDYRNPVGKTLLNNNDWYSFFGLFISYKFVKFAAECPVYK